MDLNTGAVEVGEGSIRYFSDGDPDGDQLWMSDDGLMMALNVVANDGPDLMLWGVPQDDSHCLEDGSGNPIVASSNPDQCLLAVRSVEPLVDAAGIIPFRVGGLPPGCI